nr:MAG TPA: hypothetical protein [Caudoviricetes sp.]
MPGTAGKSSSADISRGSPKAPENSTEYLEQWPRV